MSLTLPSHQIRLTREGRYWLGATALLLAIALVKNINLILILACLLIALLVYNWLHVRRSLKLIEVAAEIPEGVHAETYVRVPLRVLSIGRQTRMLGCQIDWAATSATCQIDAGKDAWQSAQFVVKSRGFYSTVTMRLRNSFPFGLVEATKFIQQPVESWVYPAAGALDLERMLYAVDAGMLTRGRRRQPVRHLSAGSDTHGLRPFRAGDSPRWIHWRTTARMGMPMVREFDRMAGAGLFVLATMDLKKPENAKEVLEFLATLTVEWARQQEGPLTILLNSDDGWISTEMHHRRGAREVLQTLAVWPKIPSAARYNEATAKWTWGVHSRSSIAVTHRDLSPARPPGFERPMLTVVLGETTRYYRAPESIDD